MAKPTYPIKLDLSKLPDRSRRDDSRPAPKTTQRDLDRHARMQGEEAKEKNVMKKAKGGKCYAKGGSIDGVAKKGKTKAKMVKMAAGGATGLTRAAAMSGRTMPTTGRPTPMVGRPMRKGGMTKGCK